MLKLVLAKKNEKEDYQKLVHEYLDEFRSVDPTLEIISGEYDYPHFHYYFENNDYYPFYLKINDKIAGLAMVHTIHPNLSVIAEFYIKKEYRHSNNGLSFALEIFKRFKDNNFTLSTPINNQSGIAFWDKIANKFNFHKIKSHSKITWIIIQHKTKRL